MAQRESRLYNRFHTFRKRRDTQDRLANRLSSAADRTLAATIVLVPFGSYAEPRIGAAVAVLGLISTLELYRASVKAQRRANSTQEGMGATLRRIQSELPR